MGDKIVGKDGHLIQIMEMSPQQPVKGQGQIRCNNLSPLEKGNPEISIQFNVVIVGHLPEQMDQPCGGCAGRLHEAGETALESGAQITSQIV